MSKLSRRTFLKAAGAAAATSMPVAGEADAAASAQAPSRGRDVARRENSTTQRWTFFNPAESAFVAAAVARLIPTDELSGGATEAGVATYIDRQLGGAWGAGERLYRQGPWHQGTPQQGYQLPFTPAELFRAALRVIDADVHMRHGRGFNSLPSEVQDQELGRLEKSTADLDGVPANVFFDTLLAMTVEGFWADPVYGGNREMAGWKLIGFPGAHANFYTHVGPQNVEYRREPTSLAEDAQGEVHVHPQIPAALPAPPVEGQPASRRRR